MKNLKMSIEELKDAVVGVRIVRRDYVPEALSTYVDGDGDGDAAYAAEAKDGGGDAAAPLLPPARWYWREEPHKLGSHDPAKVRQPHWVAYDDRVAATLEQAYSNAGSKVVATGGPYKVDVAAMKQVNERTNFERDVLRAADEMSAALTASDVGVKTATSSKVSPLEPAPVRPDDVQTEDALLVRAGSLIQISKQRDDGWAYGTVAYAENDPGDAALVADGVEAFFRAIIRPRRPR